MADDLKKQEAALKELQPLFTQFEKDAAAVRVRPLSWRRACKPKRTTKPRPGMAENRRENQGDLARPGG